MGFVDLTEAGLDCTSMSYRRVHEDLTSNFEDGLLLGANILSLVLSDMRII